jgi:hypothetical protein
VLGYSCGRQTDYACWAGGCVGSGAQSMGSVGSGAPGRGSVDSGASGRGSVGNAVPGTGSVDSGVPGIGSVGSCLLAGGSVGGRGRDRAVRKRERSDHDPNQDEPEGQRDTISTGEHRITSCCAWYQVTSAREQQPAHDTPVMVSSVSLVGALGGRDLSIYVSKSPGSNPTIWNRVDSSVSAHHAHYGG